MVIMVVTEKKLKKYKIFINYIRSFHEFSFVRIDYVERDRYVVVYECVVDAEAVEFAIELGELVK